MKKNRMLEQASRLIHSARRPLLICHLSPDGDAIGSLVGLGRGLRQLGLKPTLACPDPVPERFDYITGVEEVVEDVHDPFDLVITLDCSDLERVAHLAQLPAFGQVPLLNIDHHVTNLQFGDVNLVDSSVSSTVEIVLWLLDYLAISLDAELATCLLTGVVTDTRGFRTSNVTTQVMETTLRLMNAGASLPYITQHALDNRPTAAILLWKEALTTLQVQDRMIWASISLDMRRTAGYMGNGDAGLVSFLVSASDADVAAVFVERQDGRVEVGLRAVPGLDVAQVALQLGGGGHTLAAGCSLPGSLAEVQSVVLPALRALMRQSR